MRHFIESIALAIVLTTISFIVALSFGWVPAIATWTLISYVEVFAVFTSYSCTWMCTRQTRWNYPMGVITTAAYSFLFFQYGMIALSVFNLYLVFSLIYGWFRWGSDENTRPVTRIEPKWYAGYGALGLVILGIFLAANMLFNPTGISALSYIDVGLAVASGVAQFMLDNKKLENWMLWAATNVVSIPFFFINGLPFVSFQYIFFLVNTVIGYMAWKNSMSSTFEQKFVENLVQKKKSYTYQGEY